MGSPLVTWKTLRRESWFFSRTLEPWQKKILNDLKRRAPRERNFSWILSSGTQAIGSVKAIGLTHESILTAAAAANKHLGSTYKDRWLLAIPHYHIGGLSIFARAYVSGAKVVEYKAKWDPRKFARALEDGEITLTSLVPTQVHDLVKAKTAAPRFLRAAVIGGGALQPSLYAEARALGWPLLPSYGLTECCSQVATASLKSLKGKGYPALELLPHVKVELREQRIYIKSPSLCRWIAVGFDDGRYTLEDPKRDGWYATADAAEWQGKALKILGRQDDVVKVLGVLVPVQDVEARAREEFSRHDWLENFVVIAREDSRKEHGFVLITDSRRPLPEWEKRLQEYNRSAAGLHRIDGFCWVPEIPMNEMGKISRAAIQKTIWRGS